eukprot:284818573_5
MRPPVASGASFLHVVVCHTLVVVPRRHHSTNWRNNRRRIAGYRAAVFSAASDFRIRSAGHFFYQAFSSRHPGWTIFCWRWHDSARQGPGSRHPRKNEAKRGIRKRPGSPYRGPRQRRLITRTLCPKIHSSLRQIRYRLETRASSTRNFLLPKLKQTGLLIRLPMTPNVKSVTIVLTSIFSVGHLPCLRAWSASGIRELGQLGVELPETDYRLEFASFWGAGRGGKRTDVVVRGLQRMGIWFNVSGARRISGAERHRKFYSKRRNLFRLFTITALSDMRPPVASGASFLHVVVCHTLVVVPRRHHSTNWRNNRRRIAGYRAAVFSAASDFRIRSAGHFF